MFRKLLCLFFLFPAAASASLTFSNITESDFENISKEMAGNFSHHSVQGAAPLGSVFGFELGLVAGQGTATNIDEIVKREGGSGLSSLYHAGILGVVSIPFGITGEIVMMPKMGSNDAELQMTSMALKWSTSPGFLPFNLAVRGSTSSAKFSFTQTSGPTEVSVNNETTVSGLQLLLSPSLPLFEPYVGIGMLNGKNKLSSTGTIFGTGFSDTSSNEKTVSSTQTILGVHANLLIFHVGAEYSNAFGGNTVTGKLAFGF